MKKTLMINLGIYVVALIGFFIFDMTLTLGKLQGVVFVLWSLYFSILYSIANIVLFFISKKKTYLLCTAVSVSTSIILIILTNFL